MNHLPSHILSAEARPLTRRALAKLKTRQNLLTAGKQLFSEHGYEASTVRDIATAAGMSTGAVFANFADKADLFSEVLAADQETVSAAMRQASQGSGSVADKLVAVFAAGYAFHINQRALFQAAQGRAWTHEPSAEVRAKDQVRQMVAIVRGVLQQGVENRQLRAGADLDLIADLLWQAYVSNYRLAVFDAYGLDQLNRRMARQVELVLKGAQA